MYIHACILTLHTCTHEDICLCMNICTHTEYIYIYVYVNMYVDIVVLHCIQDLKHILYIYKYTHVCTIHTSLYTIMAAHSPLNCRQDCHRPEAYDAPGLMPGSHSNISIRLYNLRSCRSRFLRRLSCLMTLVFIL